jgi:hypothetical protein
MHYRQTARRLAELEQQIRPSAEGTTFTVDICADPPRYWIDGVEVDGAAYRRRAPASGPYTVDLGTRMGSLERRLAALEERVSPTPPDLSAEYAAARERLEAKLLSMPEPDEPLEMSEEEFQEFIADTKAYLRKRMAEGRTA